MKRTEPILSLFFHNYYGRDQEWLTYFSSRLAFPYNLLYNGAAGSYHRKKASAAPGLFDTKDGAGGRRIFREAPNKGKDIGGKLVLMDAYLKLGIKSDYILLLHDKHSPYHSNQEQWQKELFRIVDKDYQGRVIETFRTDSGVGIVAAQNAIRNESDNDQGRDAYTESGFITALMDKYGIRPPGYQYVAGTMFWVRASLYESFFTAHHPLEIRKTLEEGNVLDHDQPTHTHAWERLLSWLVTSQGYKIKGV